MDRFQWTLAVIVVLGVGLVGSAHFQVQEGNARVEAQKQVREQQATIDGIIPAVIEWTAQPCAKVDMVDLGTKGWVIGGVQMPNMTADHVQRHVRKNESPGLATAYYYVSGPASTPKSELIAIKPECRERAVAMVKPKD